jgi:glyoxylase-like metal-dependent hydrolase (beta-lactamase superfamily II)
MNITILNGKTMKKLIFIITCTLSTITNAWVIDGVGEYKFEKVAVNVFVMHGPLDEPRSQNLGFMNNPGLIVGDSGVTVIDPGSTYGVGKNVIYEIEKITDKPILAVFNTHVHGDHWLGNQAITEKYPNAIIYAHPEMISQAKSGEGDVWVGIMESMTDGISKGTVAVYPTKEAYHLQDINVGSEKFIIHSPTEKSHTNTDIMVEHFNSKTLFLGDNDTVDRLARFAGTSDMHSNIEVLRYAIDLKLNYYVPGHGQSGNAANSVYPFLDYLSSVREEVIKGYEEDLSDYEIKPTAIKILSKYHHWSGFEEQIGLHINKMLMEVESLDF